MSIMVPIDVFRTHQCPNSFHGFDEPGLPSIFRSFFIVFINNILVYSRSEFEHERHLDSVLQTLRQHQLYAKLDNVSFS